LCTRWGVQILWIQTNFRNKELNGGNSNQKASGKGKSGTPEKVVKKLGQVGSHERPNQQEDGEREFTGKTFVNRGKLSGLLNTPKTTQKE